MRKLLIELLLIAAASNETVCLSSNVCSEPWRLGSGLSSPSCGQARVPQVPQALYLVRAGENSRQTHLVLRSRGIEDLDVCLTQHRCLSLEC